MSPWFVAVVIDVCTRAVAVWAAVQLVVGIGLGGPVIRQAIACAAGPTAAWAIVAAFRFTSGALHRRGRRRSPAPAVPVSTFTGFGIVPFVFSIATVALGAAVSVALDRSLSISGLWTYAVAGLIAMTVTALLYMAGQAVAPLRWTASSAQAEMLRNATATTGLWLATAMPGVSVGAGPAWRQGLALAVLATLAVVFRINVRSAESYSSSSSFGSLWGSGGYLSGRMQYSETTTSYVKTTQPFLANLGPTALGLLAVTWLSDTRLHSGLDVNEWAWLLPVIVLLGIVRTATGHLIPPTVVTSTETGTSQVW